MQGCRHSGTKYQLSCCCGHIGGRVWRAWRSTGKYLVCKVPLVDAVGDYTCWRARESAFNGSISILPAVELQYYSRPPRH